MRRTLLVVLAVVGASLIPAGAALAGDGYGTQPGYGIANANTPCAGHGAFGAFGTTGDVIHDFGINNLGSNGKAGASNWKFPAASGATTSYNNSSLCGNGAAPPPFAP
ncbi:MAG: hypothetical protein HZA58_08320 [Acidimicrobiia bacterium]|nr:hypothetical protein [Acidimicrobiia bacterium]